MGGSNLYNYSMPMKEFVKYIYWKFDYGTDIQRSLENKMNTSIPVLSRTIEREADRALSGDQKFFYGNNMAEYFKHETKLDKNG